MKTSPVRRSRPYAFVFQLGRAPSGGKKKVPAALGSSLCFFYRADHEPLAAKLDAMPEATVSTADAELMFAAVDATIAENDLREELYSDAELRGGTPSDAKSGFHAGRSFEACREALARGGFVVEHLLDPHGLDEVDLSRTQELDAVMRGLERHLDLTSLSIVLEAVGRRGELSWHAGSVADLLVDTIETGEAPALIKRIRSAFPQWHAELRDALLVLAAHVSRESQGDVRAQLGALVSALPGPVDEAAAALFAAWDLRSGNDAMRAAGQSGLPFTGSSASPAQPAPSRRSPPRERGRRRRDSR